MFSERKKILYLLTFLGFVCLIFFASPVFAQEVNEGLENLANITGYGQRPLVETIAVAIKIFIGFLGLIAVIILIYGGFLWMTSKGEPEKLAKAKKIIINGAIGLAIIVLSYVIASFILGRLIQIAGPPSQGEEEEPPGGYPDGRKYLVITDKYPKDDEIVPRNTSAVVSFNQALDCDSLVLCTDDNQPAGCTVSVIKRGEGGGYIPGILKVSGNTFVFKPDGQCTGTPLEALACQASESCVPPLPPCEECTPCPAGTKDNPECAELPEHEPAYESLACCPKGEFCCNCFNPGNYSIEILGGQDGVKGVGANGKRMKQDRGWDFEVEDVVDTTAPVVLSNLPQNGAVPINTGIAVVFSKAIDPTTLVLVEDAAGSNIDEATVIIQEEDGEYIPGYFEKISTKSFIFRPNNPCEEPYEHCKCLPKLADISVVLKNDPPPDPGIMDANCNLLDCTNGKCEWEFTTSENMDLAPPQVKFMPDQEYNKPYNQKSGDAVVDPVEDETDVERITNVKVEIYDQDSGGNPITGIDPTSVNYDTFRLLGMVAKYIETGTNPIFELQPYSVLGAYRTYQAVVYGGGNAGGSCGMDPDLLWGVRDLAGNAMAENFLWQFTTGGQVNNGDPYITRVTPPEGPPETCVTIEGYNLGCCTDGVCQTMTEAQDYQWSAISQSCQSMINPGIVEFYSQAGMIPAEEILRWDEIDRPTSCEYESCPSYCTGGASPTCPDGCSNCSFEEDCTGQECCCEFFDFSPHNQIIGVVPEEAITHPEGGREVRVTPAH